MSCSISSKFNARFLGELLPLKSQNDLAQGTPWGIITLKSQNDLEQGTPQQ